jgi:3-deoxy-D-manno-octulosonate 8-phosphate phosphatase KdsC-like HAD superfamily phosphatase
MDPVFSKVLFLDIDGVMNSNKSARIHKSFEVLDPIAIKFLQHLEKK